MTDSMNTPAKWCRSPDVNSMYANIPQPVLALAALPPGHWPGYSAEKLPQTWAGEYHIVNNMGFLLHDQIYCDVVAWINENIARPYKNAHWAKIGDCIYVQIRKKQDFTLFMLRWA